jgi:hypothetical protein
MRFDMRLRAVLLPGCNAGDRPAPGLTRNASLIEASAQLWDADDQDLPANFNSTTWNSPEFSTASWPHQGLVCGFCGYGDLSGRRPSTSVGQTGDEAAFFRARFDVQDVQEIAQLSVGILAEDGAVAYINGKPAFATRSSFWQRGVDPTTPFQFWPPPPPTTNAVTLAGNVLFDPPPPPPAVTLRRLL